VNSFFRICVLITLILMVFSLVANFVVGLGAFPGVTDIGSSPDTDSALGDLTTLDSDDTDMWSIFTMVTVGTGLGAIALAWATHSMTPIGVHLFGTVFWASWLNMSSILSYGSYVPADLITVGTVGVLFIFIAAVIGMLTGSG